MSLELGGKSPHIIFESADLDQAANWAALGIFYNTGQDCTAGSRVYVQDTVHDKFVEILVRKANELVVGNGFDEKTAAGPLVGIHRRADGIVADADGWNMIGVEGAV